MNKADNDAGNAAIDSLLNYETVKVKHVPHTQSHFSSQAASYFYISLPFIIFSLYLQDHGCSILGAWLSRSEFAF